MNARRKHVSRPWHGVAPGKSTGKCLETSFPGEKKQPNKPEGAGTVTRSIKNCIFAFWPAPTAEIHWDGGLACCRSGWLGFVRKLKLICKNWKWFNSGMSYAIAIWLDAFWQENLTLILWKENFGPRFDFRWFLGDFSLSMDKNRNRPKCR